MENFHIHNSGFSEIEQNITTFPDGSIALCRNLNKIPADIFGTSTGGICIENLGNFDAGGDLMVETQQNTIVLLVQALCLKSNLPFNTDSIIYHHWFGNFQSRTKRYHFPVKNATTKNNHFFHFLAIFLPNIEGVDKK